MTEKSSNRPMSRRQFLRVAGIAGGAATLAACAPQVVTVTQVVKETEIVKETVKETSVVEKLVEVTATPAPKASGSLMFTWPNDAVNGPLYEAMWKDFQAQYPDITLDIVWNGDQNKLVAAGTPPAFMHGGDVWPKELKMSLDLDPLIMADPTFDLTKYATAGIDPLKIDGKLKALPQFYNISLMYYNKALFDAAGIAYPAPDWTKDDFMTAAKALTLKEGDKVSQWGCEVSHGWWGTWLTFVRQAGGEWMDVPNCKVTLDTPEAIAGMQYFVDIVQPGDQKVSWLPTEDSLGGFQGGKVAMSYGSHTGLWNTYRSAKVPFDVAILPAGIKDARGGEQALDGKSIHKDTKDVEAAWTALKFVSSYDAQFKYYASVGPTARLDVQEALLATPVEGRTRDPKNLEAVFEAFDKGLGMGLPRHLGFVEATQNHVQPVVDLILEGKLTVEEGMKQATQAAQDYMDSTYPDCGSSIY